VSYLKQSGFLIHGNCANFGSGFCTLKNVAVDPNGAACSSFMPKNITPQPQIRRSVLPYTVHPWSSSQARYRCPPPYNLPPQTWDGYRTRHSSSPIPLTPTAPGQGGAGLLYMSSGRRGGGRGGGGGGGRGRGRMGGFATGPGGSCVCPRCGYSTSHVIGAPCYQQTCPKCGSRMTRGS